MIVSAMHTQWLAWDPMLLCLYLGRRTGLERLDSKCLLKSGCRIDHVRLVTVLLAAAPPSPFEDKSPSL